MTATKAGAVAAGPSAAVTRTDIQGLRAIAVTAVLLYHLWPQQLTGGFVGVDVFFVISGFLITSHLLAHPPTGGRGLLQFWSRRVRRLLPAALLVLSATLIASRLVAPATQWENTAAQAKAAALYVVNWRLASDSVDYLAAESAPSPIQHFWSLSVEEQFYLGWPILILVLVLSARALHVRLMPVVLIGLALVVGASLAYSMAETASDPARAYFVTPTRVWELGIGGLLAVFVSRRAFGRTRDTEAVPLPAAARSLLAWVGLGAIVLTFAVFTRSTPFPGWRALLPVLGTVTVIAACPPVLPLSLGSFLAFRPVQWVGDVSYSIYLWHWPMIVLLPAVSGGRLGWLDKTTIIVVTLVLAWFTKRFVEDRFRTPAWGRPLVKPFALAAVGMAAVIGASTLQVVEVHHRETVAQERLNAALAGEQTCFGAAALTDKGCDRTTSGTLTPDPIAAAKDKSHAYAAVSGKKDCFAYLPSFPQTRCTFGDPTGRIRVALVGNSHAGEWVDTIDEIAKAEHWKLTTALASQCAFSDVPQVFPTPAQSASCLSWVRTTARNVAAAKYDLVIVSNRVSVSAVGSSLDASQARYQQGYRNVLATVHASGAPIVVIRDTPSSGFSIPDCLAEHTDNYAACDGSRSAWLPRDPTVPAVAALHDPDVVVADLTDHICRKSVCPAAIGGVPVYFDPSHLTKTYARTLAPYLAPYLARAVKR